jgi:hypothetical protein
MVREGLNVGLKIVDWAVYGKFDIANMDEERLRLLLIHMQG